MTLGTFYILLLSMHISQVSIYKLDIFFWHADCEDSWGRRKIVFCPCVVGKVGKITKAGL